MPQCILGTVAAVLLFLWLQIVTLIKCGLYTGMVTLTIAIMLAPTVSFLSSGVDARCLGAHYCSRWCWDLFGDVCVIHWLAGCVSLVDAQ